MNVPQLPIMDRLNLQSAWPAQQYPDFVTVSEELVDKVVSVSGGIDNFHNACANTKTQAFRDHFFMNHLSHSLKRIAEIKFSTRESISEFSFLIFGSRLNHTFRDKLLD